MPKGMKRGVAKAGGKANPVTTFAADLRKREEEALKRQEATAKRLATLARKAAEKEQEEAQQASEEFQKLKAMEPDVYKRYEEALRVAMQAKGDSLRPAWRKVEQLQQSCLNVSNRIRAQSAA